MAKINTLELENIKRIKAIQLDCSGKALTIIGGRNGQGKTSVLDAIAWVLGGDRFRPSDPNRKDSVIPAALRITLDNGLVVERKGKNGSLTVTDPAGKTAGQTLLNKFISQFALDMPKFLRSNDSEKAKILLQIIGIGDELRLLDAEEKRLYDERTAHGRLTDSRKKYADELPYNEGSPDEPISVSEMIRQQQDILGRNGENQRKRQNVNTLSAQLTVIDQEIDRLQEAIKTKLNRRDEISIDLDIAKRSASELQDESTAEIEESIRNAETINEKVRANQEKIKAQQEASMLTEHYNDLTNKIEAVRKTKIELLNRANLPLPGLSVDNGELIYNDQKWDCMSGSDQLKCATAIVRKLNPECEFVLIDKLEQMDIETLQEFGQWLENENLQVIATRVSTGSECSIVIEDGQVAEQSENKPAFVAGKF